MTVLSPPTFIAGECYEARSFRHLLQAAANGSAGILVGLGVSLISGRNITFAEGSCILAGTTFAEGYYQVVVSTAETVTIGIGGASARTDYVVARVRTTEYGDATDTATVEIITDGTLAPTIPARCFVLATVSVPAGMTSLTAANVVASRVRAGQAAVPTGAILPFGGAVAPTGFVLCDGSAISRTTYPTLFTTIGVTYGAGDGSTTFNVPDLRGRTPIGAGTGPGLTARTLGIGGGAENVTLTSAQIPAHNHPVTGGFVTGGVSAYIPTSGTIVGIANSANTGNNTGGGGSHTNMQPYLPVNFIIRSS